MFSFSCQWRLPLSPLEDRNGSGQETHHLVKMTPMVIANNSALNARKMFYCTDFILQSRLAARPRLQTSSHSRSDGVKVGPYFESHEETNNKSASCEEAGLTRCGVRCFCKPAKFCLYAPILAALDAFSFCLFLSVRPPPPYFQLACKWRRV